MKQCMQGGIAIGAGGGGAVVYLDELFTVSKIWTPCKCKYGHLLVLGDSTTFDNLSSAHFLSLIRSFNLKDPPHPSSHSPTLLSVLLYRPPSTDLPPSAMVSFHHDLCKLSLHCSLSPATPLAPTEGSTPTCPLDST